MISMDFINSGHSELYNDDYCNSFLLYLKESEKEVSSISVSYKTEISKVLMEATIMDYDINEYKSFFEKENKNFAEKIGAALISLAKKFNEMIDKIIEKIKDFAFKFKSNEKKMDILIKEHPELGKEKIKVLCDKGGLDFSDINNLAKLNSSFEEILQMTKNANVDPDSLKGKWETAKKKFLGDDYKKKGAIAVAGTVLTVALAVKTFKPQIAQWKSKLSSIKDEEKVLDAKAYEAIRRDRPGIDHAGWGTTVLAIQRERKQMHAKAIGQQQTIVDRLVNSIVRGVDAIVGSSAGRAILGDKSAALRTDLNNSIRKSNDNIRSTEFNKAYGKSAGERQFNNDHPQQRDRDDPGAEARRNRERNGGRRRRNNP